MWQAYVLTFYKLITGRVEKNKYLFLNQISNEVIWCIWTFKGQNINNDNYNSKYQINRTIIKLMLCWLHILKESLYDKVN